MRCSIHYAHNSCSVLETNPWDWMGPSLTRPPSGGGRKDYSALTCSRTHFSSLLSGHRDQMATLNLWMKNPLKAGVKRREGNQEGECKKRTRGRAWLRIPWSMGQASSCKIYSLRQTCIIVHTHYLCPDWDTIRISPCKQTCTHNDRRLSPVPNPRYPGGAWQYVGSPYITEVMALSIQK